MAATKPESQYFQNSTVPVPDPTTLTKEATQRTEESLRSYIDIRVENLNKAIERVQKEIDERPLAVKEDINKLRELIFAELKKSMEVSAVKFEGIDQQFLNGKENLSLALTSAEKFVQTQQQNSKETTLKSENATAEKINAMQTLFATSIGALEKNLGDLKQRVDQGDGKNTGYASLFGYISIGIGIIVALVGLFFTFSNLNNKSAAVEPVVILQKADGSVAPVTR